MQFGRSSVLYCNVVILVRFQAFGKWVIVRKKVYTAFAVSTCNCRPA